MYQKGDLSRELGTNFKLTSGSSAPYRPLPSCITYTENGLVAEQMLWLLPVHKPQEPTQLHSLTALPLT
jgi:hypothetical protein